jgi:cellulose synthase (UDP-forming)
MVAGIYYLVWHWEHINWDVWYYSPLFFIAEAVGFLLFSFFSFNAWFLRYHAPEGLVPKTPFSLDVFIPVAGEPIELVRETVESAVRIDFENKRVYVLDDKTDDRYKELAEKNGCGYFARPEHDHAKAGNLNYAFSRTEGDLILALDADQTPKPDIVRKLIGYFELPKIAFVQTKQDFAVPEGDPFGNTDRIFYNVMQSGKDNDNSAFSCGSGVVYRRRALAEIDGFSTWNIVEDVHTSMRLQERGWRSVYHNYPITRGTAPADIYGVYRQRRQWAADSLRILFWDNPSRHKGLTFKQKLQYTHLGFVYLVAAFVMPFFYITPIVALLSGKFVLTAPVSSYVIHRFPYFLAMSLAYGIINYPTPYMRAFQMWTGLFPVFIHATWIALTTRKTKPVYRVNTKPVVGQAKARNPWVAVILQLAIMVLGAFSVVYAFFVTDMRWDFYLLNVVWVFWTIWTMSGICFAAIKKHRWVEEKTVSERQPRRFSFAPIREMSATIVLSALITIFFITANPVKGERYMADLRAGVENLLVLKQPVQKNGAETPKVRDGQGKNAEKATETPIRQ